MGGYRAFMALACLVGSVRAGAIADAAMIPSAYAQGATPGTITFVQPLTTALVSGDTNRTIVITPSATLWANDDPTTCSVNDGSVSVKGNTAATVGGVLTINMTEGVNAGAVTITCTTNLGHNGLATDAVVTGTGGEIIDGFLASFAGNAYNFTSSASSAQHAAAAAPIGVRRASEAEAEADAEAEAEAESASAAASAVALASSKRQARSHVPTRTT